jgi:hypothetical protein
MFSAVLMSDLYYGSVDFQGGQARTYTVVRTSAGSQGGTVWTYTREKNR